MASARSNGTLDRYTSTSPCPICGGNQDLPRGTQTRCTGFRSDDGKYARCSREEYARGLLLDGGTTPAAYIHFLNGECKCGKTHGVGPTPYGESPKTKWNPGPAVETYIYRDADGKPFRRVERFRTEKGGKDFKQSMALFGQDGSFSRWIYGTGKTKPVPYCLPELIAVPTGGTIFIAEGERKVDAIRQGGLNATCNVSGAGKWRDDHSPYVAGRHVVILPDNDDKGREHAEKVALSVRPHAASVKIVELPGLPPKGDIIDWLNAGRTLDEMIAIAKSTPTWHPPTVELNGHSNGKPPGRKGNSTRTGGGDPGDRPKIEINTEHHQVVEAAISSLARDPNIYRRGESLVSVVQETSDEIRLTGRAALKGVAGSPKVIDLSEAVIGCFLTRNAEYFSWREDKHGEWIAIPAHPPEWLIRAVATYRHWPGIRPLSAVVECPFPRPDGSIVEAPGYDVGTATLYLPTLDFPRLPDRPTREDARAAWDRLARYVRQFPFPSEDDRVIFLAGMLNVIGRPAVLGPVPGVAVIGNKAGTGKGLFVDAMVIPGIGRAAPTTSYPEDKQEAIKTKTAIVVSAKTVVNFDNLDEGSSYGGSAIDSMITAPTLDERILGQSKNTGELPVRIAPFLNGNNIVPGKDAHRRWMVCNLTTELEHPEQRDDLGEKPLRTLLLENRVEMVRDALTILKAHALAGRPTAGWAPLGSFEDWDRIIRAAVWFATGRDCLATQRKTANDSPDRLAKIALLEGWQELPGGKEGGLTTGEAVAIAEEAIAAKSSRYETIRAVMLQRGRGGRLATPGAIGMILRGLKNTPVGGLKLKDTGIRRHGAVCWIVEGEAENIATVHAENDGECGESGEGCSNQSAEGLTLNSNMMAHGGVCKPCKARLEAPSPDSPHSPPEGHREGDL
jgi:putative DNA primase/helicase